MIKSITLIFITAALLGAQNRQHETVQPSNPEAGYARLESVPAAATSAGPNRYRYTDPSGKTWLYIRTPFGLSKREDKPPTPSATHDSQPVTVTDLGESVRFEIKVPFGIKTWVSKKSELTDGEQVMLLREQLKNQPACREVDPAAPQGKQ
jgi:hypothetical protein